MAMGTVARGLALADHARSLLLPGSFVVTSASMEDTLLAGDIVLANRAAIGARLPWTGFRLLGCSRSRRG